MTSAEILGAVLLVIGALIAVFEFHTLTIYLIAIAVACFAGAGVAFAGGGFSLSLIVLAVVTVLGMPVAHWARGKLKNRASDEVSQDDVGRSVIVVLAERDRLRVSYRGSDWNARFQSMPPTSAQAGDICRIVAREGSVLVIIPQPNLSV